MKNTIDEVIRYLRESYDPNSYILIDAPLALSLQQAIKAPPIRKDNKIVPPTFKISEEKKPKPTSAPKPQPKTPAKEKTEKPSHIPSLEKGKEAHALIDTEEIRKAYQKVAPSLYLHSSPPSDASAKKARFAYRDRYKLAPISIFVSSCDKAHATFLKNLAKAIDLSIGPCKLVNITDIEKEDRWDTALSHEALQIIIMSESTLFQSKHLLVHYRDIQGHLFKRIGQIPTFIVEDIQAYYKAPERKKELWQQLTTHIPKVLK